MREYRSFEPFLRKGPLGSDPHSRDKKTQKVTRGSHRNDVSPLTQGLRYRAACGVMPNTHRRRDSTRQLSRVLSRVGVGGVYWALQVYESTPSEY